MAQLSQYALKIGEQPLNVLRFSYECGFTVTADDPHANKAAFGFDGNGLSDKISIHASFSPVQLSSATNVKVNQVSKKPGDVQ